MNTGPYSGFPSTVVRTRSSISTAQAEPKARRLSSWRDRWEQRIEPSGAGNVLRQENLLPSEKPQTSDSRFRNPRASILLVLSSATS